MPRTACNVSLLILLLEKDEGWRVKGETSALFPFPLPPSPFPLYPSFLTYFRST